MNENIFSLTELTVPVSENEASPQRYTGLGEKIYLDNPPIPFCY